MADILWNDVVGSKTIADGGYVGDLLALARAHVDDAIDAGRLTQEQAGQVYTAMIPAAFKEALSFSLQEELVEAQIEGIAAENLIKAKQLDIAVQELAIKQKEADIKAYELTNILPATVEKLQEEVDLLQTQDLELSQNGAKDRAMKDAQTALYVRQTAGFDDNKNQKLFEAQLNSWGLMYSSGTLTDVPGIISNDAVSTLYTNLTS